VSSFEVLDGSGGDEEEFRLRVAFLDELEVDVEVFSEGGESC